MPLERLPVGAVLILLAACGGDKRAASGPATDTTGIANATAAASPMLLLCGADTMSVQGSRAELQLNVRGESFLVQLVPSASGAKYQVAGDSTTFYWNQGARGLIQVRGELMPECETLPPQ